MTQGYYPPPPPPDTYPAPQAPPKGLALTALITGILALLLCWVPFLGIVLGAVAVITGFLAVRKRQPKGISLAGIITGGLGLLSSLMLAVVIGLALSETLESLPAPESTISASPRSPSPTPTASETAAESTTPDETPSTAPPKSTPTPTPPPEPVEEAPAAGTTSQRNALDTAENYLRYTAFSRAGLIGQLEYEGFSNADATWAVDNVSVDWATQAIDMAESYLSYTAFSHSGLINQLEYEGFSNAHATDAVKSIDVNWQEQAAAMAESYLAYTSFSRSGLIDQLVYEGFSYDHAEYGATQAGL